MGWRLSEMVQQQVNVRQRRNRFLCRSADSSDVENIFRAFTVETMSTISKQATKNTSDKLHSAIVLY